MSRLDRRGAPRVARRVPVTIGHEHGALLARTKDLSASGAYCTLRRFLPPMTKLEIQLNIADGARPARITCHGIVVRVKPGKASPRISRYHTAIFFSDLTDTNRLTLARYVQRHLHAAPSPRD